MTKQTSDAIKTYVDEIRKYLADGDASEYTYRPALEKFVRSFDEKLRVPNDPRRRKGASNSKPDFIVKRANTPIGFIETKDVGVDLDETKDTEQLQRYLREYPNLILTDYVDFKRFVNGELRSSASIGKVKKNQITLDAKGCKEVTQMIEDFLGEEVASVETSSDLADRLAALTRQVYKLTRKELRVKEDSERLHLLMDAFKKVLISDLDEDKFADMFAQTLVYGFFAARVHYDGVGEFSRRTASAILPKTNPFLRKLFREFADENLPESLSGVVDEIVDLLKKTDIKKILKEFEAQGRNDAVVHFYESFLGAYDTELKKSMGVFYTPDPVVDYIVRSLDHLLEEKFGRKRGLADDKTLILDPALGTGSFLKKIITQIHDRSQKGSWDSYVSENLLDRIFGFEILMAPYAVAHLNLGLQLQNTGYKFQRDQRLGVFLTNTLEETAKRSEVLFSDWLAEEAAAAASVKRDRPIMVVTGNPPYAAESQNDGEWIRSLMRGFDSLNQKKCANYFECGGEPLGERNSRWINDDYVKFIRFAHWRIEQTGYGIVAFITNHGFLNNPTFRGMRESLMEDFDEIYVLDLHGSSKRKETAPDGSKDENVFNIQTGVSINFLIRVSERKKSGSNQKAKVYRADLFGLRDAKYKWLLENSFVSTKFKEIKPESPSYFFMHQDRKLRSEFEVGKRVPDVFPLNSAGIVTACDSLSIQFSKDEMWQTIREFVSNSESHCREKWNLGGNRDWQVNWAQKDAEQSGPTKDLLTRILYRPFDFRWTYFTGKTKGFLCNPRNDVMKHMLKGDNLGLVTARSNKSDEPNHFYISNCPSEAKAGEATTQSTLFPLYLKNGRGLVPNVASDVLEWAKSLSPKDAEVHLLEYCYAQFHSPEYRQRYKEFLKLEFPRVQLTSDKTLFLKLAKLGRKLIDLHLFEADILDGGKAIFSQKGSNVVERIRYDAKGERVYINANQYFENVPNSAWIFEIGGYQMLDKWLKDRKGLKLGHQEITHYERMVEAAIRTLETMADIDLAIKDAGGWPLQTDQKAGKKAA